MIPQSFIQDLLNRVDIVGVVERYVPLKRAGANYVACCPFHSEKTPSFTVSQIKQFYHCFGCGAHGTAVGFVMEYTGAGFVDAVKDLAQGVGMQVPEVKSERPRGKTEEGDDLYAVLLKAAQYYRQQLKNAPRAIDYLKKRGLSGEIARHFGVGYAPDGWQNLQAAFPDYNAKALVAAGLVIQGDEGKRYDRFRDRIMFPIVDQRGYIVGFGGRVLGEGEPKYLNSSETALFEKGRELYGLYQGRRAIRDAGRVIVVEGYMDVVALAQHGIGYAVATLGTATTPAHAQKLLRQAEEVVFCFDGDDAGRRAAWRALENGLEQLADGKQLSFLFLPQDEDPDTYVRKLGKEAFEKLLGDALPLSQFMLRELSSRVDLNTHEGRARLLHDARPLVKQVAAPLLSLLLRKQLAQMTGISQQELDAQFQVKSNAMAAAPRRSPPVQRSIVRWLIELVMVHPEFARQIERDALEPAQDVANINQAELKTLRAMLEAAASGETVVNWPEYFRASEHEGLLRQVEAGLLKRQEVNLSLDEVKAEFSGGWSQLLEQIRRGQLIALNEKSKKQELSSEDEDRYRQLSQTAPAAAQK
ncbi:MAG: DNA primase [Betaproteobacteria bacterium]|nr:DNA primase [Betaproteobacteria bacterium]